MSEFHTSIKELKDFNTRGIWASVTVKKVLAMNVPDSEGDLPAELLLVKLHSHNLIGEPLVKESVDLGSSGQLQNIDGGRPATLNGSLKVLLQLLDAPEKICIF